VVRQLKEIYVKINHDSAGEFDYLRERLMEGELKFTIYDPEFKDVFMSLVGQFEFTEEEEESMIEDETEVPPRLEEQGAFGDEHMICVEKDGEGPGLESTQDTDKFQSKTDNLYC
jgi:hypothetical protein